MRGELQLYRSLRVNVAFLKALLIARLVFMSASRRVKHFQVDELAPFGLAIPRFLHLELLSVFYIPHVLIIQVLDVQVANLLLLVNTNLKEHTHVVADDVDVEPLALGDRRLPRVVVEHARLQQVIDEDLLVLELPDHFFRAFGVFDYLRHVKVLSALRNVLQSSKKVVIEGIRVIS